MVAYYPFNGNANDESGNGNHASVHGATLTVDRFDRENNAYLFDGTDDYIDVSTVDNFRFENESVTFSLWTKILDNANVYRHLMVIANIDMETPVFYPLIGLSKWRSGWDGGKYAFNLINETAEKVQPTSIKNGEELPKNEWTHLCGVIDYEAGKIKLYMNGELQNSLNACSFSLKNADHLVFRIGTKYLYKIPEVYGEGFHNGPIDDIRVYNRTLSESEIQQLYNDCQPVVLLEDDFNDNSIDNTKWVVTNSLDKSHTGPPGDNVIEENGILKLEQNKIDYGGAVITKSIKVAKRGKITITTRTLFHYANDKYRGGVHFFEQEAPESDFLDQLFTWSHQNYIYNNYVEIGFGNKRCGYLPGNFDEWVEEEIIFDLETGEVEYTCWVSLFFSSLSA